ncbi:hypothetical protein BBK82_27790 [Lentzea guizhouensis]|uniref:Uncharacterized protein n=1 Tax=Lentzea guizhouensis TaxID=1586287 RepID=A0A1B2HNM4_9PSEU|nr:hypothetical protein [Lentzea guizhouensis]ANZ39295.1 hypothetical protein BBK82_27790 [Lentzea guizhouensis]
MVLVGGCGFVGTGVDDVEGGRTPPGGVCVDVWDGVWGALDCGGMFVGSTCVGVDSTDVGGCVVLGGTGTVLDEEGPGVSGSDGAAPGSTASATATTPTVASPVPATATARRRDRTARARSGRRR